MEATPQFTPTTENSSDAVRIERDRILRTLYKISTAIHSQSSLDDAYGEIVREISAITGYPIAAIAVYDEARQKIVFRGTTGLPSPGDLSIRESPIAETFSGVVIRTGKPLIEADVQGQSGYRSEILREAGARTFIGYPITVRDRVVGALVLAHTERVEILAHTLSGLESLANFVGEVTERKQAEDELLRSREQLRQLSAHLQSSIELERKRIAREIHDELGQQLSLLQLECGMIEDRLPADERDLRERTQSMTALIDATIRSVQRISADLRPSLLDSLGIGAAAEWLASEFQKRTGITCKAAVDPPDMNLDQDRSTALFRILQETLTNVARHAHATEVNVHLTEREGCATLKVKDDGIGITADRLTDAGSFGLIGMRERVHVWNGSVEITGEAARGTEVSVTIPLHLEPTP